MGLWGGRTKQREIFRKRIWDEGDFLEPLKFYLRILLLGCGLVSSMLALHSTSAT